eukprot:CAMPEP_0167750424 /NCGR_PEP_ID=MMETSP0110_2-20121227/5983_1 /TAXON_ID=629695 /ORGANISM="Gymnochlora sp., Strain CCMP2014" /LENGTH=88 /DNA_ID=CAMNT_0007635743 /DNA_START=12 /DNA_END=278 /DNA_ORIENTATION=-
MEVEEPERPFRHNLEVKFEDEKSADIVYRVLVVDEELRPDRIRRFMKQEADMLRVSFEATEIKFLRVAISSFLQNMSIVVETLSSFSE